MDIRRKPASEATDAELRNFARIALGLELHGNAKRETVMAKIGEAGVDLDVAQIVIYDEAPSAPPAGGNMAGTTTRRYVGDGVWEECAPCGTCGGEPRGLGERRCPACNSQILKGRMVTVHQSDEEGGNQPVQVCVNGSNMLIPRGKAVWVPAHYLEALQNAVQNVYDETTNGLEVARHVHSYPFSLH